MLNRKPRVAGFERWKIDGGGGGGMFSASPVAVAVAERREAGDERGER